MVIKKQKTSTKTFGEGSHFSLPLRQASLHLQARFTSVPSHACPSGPHGTASFAQSPLLPCYHHCWPYSFPSVRQQMGLGSWFLSAAPCFTPFSCALMLDIHRLQSLQGCACSTPSSTSCSSDLVILSFPLFPPLSLPPTFPTSS